MESVQLNKLIYAYLKNLENNPGSGYDKDALSLASSCVNDALKVGDDVPASDILKKIVEEGIKHIELPPEFGSGFKVDNEAIEKSNVLKNEGNEMFKAGNYNGAISKFTDSIELNPTAPTYSNRSLCYMKINKFDKAEEDARSAIRVDGKFARAYLRLASALEAQNRIDEAVSVLKDLTEFAPEYKHDLEEMQSKASSSSSNPTSEGPGGAIPGLPNIPGMDQLLRDPEIQQLMMNPKFAKMAEDIKTGGIGSAMKYMSDPDIAPLMQKLTSKLLSGGGAGAFANMFGGNGHI